MVTPSNNPFEQENIKLKEQVELLSSQVEKYKKLFEVSADALSIIDLDTGRFIECNQSAVRMHGVESETNFLALLPSDISPEKQPCGGNSLDLALERIEKSYTEGPQVFEWIHSRLDGSTFPCLVSLTALPIGEQKLVLAIGRDISQLKERTKELEVLNEKLLEITNTDYLTGLFNRKYLDEITHREISRANRYNSSLSCIFLDIDNFKKINDSLGHDIGDVIIVEISKILTSRARQSDICVRWGGEEFCILLPCTDASKAQEVAEGYRTLIESHTFPHVGNITVSVGVAEYQRGEPDNSLFKHVDKALYKAKHSGKNKVVVSS